MSYFTNNNNDINTELFSVQVDAYNNDLDSNFLDFINQNSTTGEPFLADDDEAFNDVPSENSNNSNNSSSNSNNNNKNNIINFPSNSTIQQQQNNNNFQPFLLSPTNILNQFNFTQPITFPNQNLTTEFTQNEVEFFNQLGLVPNNQQTSINDLDGSYFISMNNNNNNNEVKKIKVEEITMSNNNNEQLPKMIGSLSAERKAIIQEKKLKWKRKREEKRAAASVVSNAAASVIANGNIALIPNNSVNSPSTSISSSNVSSPSTVSSSSPTTNNNNTNNKNIVVNSLFSKLDENESDEPKTRDEQEIKRQRMIKNRISAQVSRDKKKKQLEDLSKRVIEVETINSNLTKQVSNLTEENKRLRYERDYYYSQIKNKEVISPFVKKTAATSIVCIFLFAIMFAFIAPMKFPKNKNNIFDDEGLITYESEKSNLNTRTLLSINESAFEDIVEEQQQGDTTTNVCPTRNSIPVTKIISERILQKDIIYPKNDLYRNLPEPLINKMANGSPSTLINNNIINNNNNNNNKQLNRESGSIKLLPLNPDDGENENKALSEVDDNSNKITEDEIIVKQETFKLSSTDDDEIETATRNLNHEYFHINSENEWMKAALYSFVHDDSDTSYLFCPNVVPLLKLPKASTNFTTSSKFAKAENSTNGTNIETKSKISILVPITAFSEGYIQTADQNSLQHTFEFAKSPAITLVRLNDVDIENSDMAFISFPDLTTQTTTTTTTSTPRTVPPI